MKNANEEILASLSDLIRTLSRMSNKNPESLTAVDLLRLDVAKEVLGRNSNIDTKDIPKPSKEHKFKIEKIIKPERRLTEEDLAKYFCCCNKKANGEHRDFCISHEPNNVIYGYAWNQYLSNADYKRYLKALKEGVGCAYDPKTDCYDPSTLKTSIKTQIIELINQ